MKAAVVEGAGQLVVREVPLPEMGPYQALVKIEACSICNSTDVKILDRHFVTSIPVPLILGHESVGTVVEVGARVRCYASGQRVLRPGAEYDLKRVGIASAWGGLAEYGLVTDLEAWRADHAGQAAGGMWPKQQFIPADLDPAEATAIITLKETLFSARAAGVDTTTWTAIVGTGPVARAFTFWAHWLGAPFVVVFGRSERWCHDFLDLGANNYIAGEKACREDEAKVAGVGAFERVIEAVGSVEALSDALALLRPGGVVGQYGVAAEDDADSAEVRAARADGRIVRLPVREEEVHEEMLALVKSGQVVLRDWISHRLPLRDIQEGFRLVRRKEAIKVVIEF
jgi:threonine dehydrogenase-like Zn-dependent dehydrogenase